MHNPIRNKKNIPPNRDEPALPSHAIADGATVRNRMKAMSGNIRFNLNLSMTCLLVDPQANVICLNAASISLICPYPNELFLQAYELWSTRALCCVSTGNIYDG